ncbi:MAG: hypothetical protein ACK57K_15290 [Chryseotalea sp.]
MITKTNSFSLFLFCLLLTFSCQQEQEVKPVYGKLNLGFSGQTSARTSETFSPTAILISIKNSKGESVLNLQRLDLYNFSGQFVTSDNEKLKLPVGEYQITDLLVVNAQNQVTHVVPKSGTPGAAGVVDVLPHKLIIKADEETKTTFIVTKVTKPASDYGYATFEVVEKVNSKLSTISIYKKNNGELGYTLTQNRHYTYNEKNQLVKVKTNYFTDRFEKYHSTKILIEYFKEGVVSKTTYFDTSDKPIHVVKFYYDNSFKQIISTILFKYTENNSAVATYKTQFDYLNNKINVYHLENNEMKLYKTDFFNQEGNITYSMFTESKTKKEFTYSNIPNPLKNLALFDGLNSESYLTNSLVNCKNYLNTNNCIEVIESAKNEYLIYDELSNGNFLNHTVIEFCNNACPTV